MNAISVGDPHTPVDPLGNLDSVEDTRIRDTSHIVEITPSFPPEIINSGPSSPHRRHTAKDASWEHSASSSSLLPISAPNERDSSTITETIDIPSHHGAYDENETSPSDYAFSPHSPARANWGSLRVHIPEVGEEVEDSPAENFTIPRLQHTNRTIPSKLWGRVSCQSNHGQELDDNAPVWKAYQNEATKHDKTMIDGWSGDMDVLLVFVSEHHSASGQVSLLSFDRLAYFLQSSRLSSLSSTNSYNPIRVLHQQRCFATSLPHYNVLPITLLAWGCHRFPLTLSRLIGVSG
jgi:Family of unknown function (DUF6535)